MVLDILTKESYTGKHAARVHESYKTKVRTEDGRVRTMHRKRIRPETDERRVALSIPALVTPEQFARVQTLVKSRQLDKTDMPDEPLLNRGIAICGVCKRPMIAAKNYKYNYRQYMCPHRHGAVNPAQECPGGNFAVRASEVDADVWAKVMDIVRDRDKWQRLTVGKSAQLAEQHVDAIRRADMVNAEVDRTKSLRDTTYRRMMAEVDDGIAAMHRAELKRLNDSLAMLEKQSSDAQNAVESAQVKQDTHARLLGRIDAAIARHNAGDPEETARWRASLAPISDDPTLPDHILPAIRAVVEGLDKFTREEKRAIMRDLDVQVPMYPATSEFAKTHEHRWDFKFSESVLRGVSSCR